MNFLFQCCGGEYIESSIAYSNAVLLAVLPHVSDFARNLDLPIPTPLTPQQVRSCFPGGKREIDGGITLTNGMLLGFHKGHAYLYESPQPFFSLQDPGDIPRYYGPVRMSQEEMVEFVRRAIRRVGYSLEDVLADTEPRITQAEGIGTNVVPHFRIEWLDPRSGSTRTEAEVNANKKILESLRFNWIAALFRQNPTVSVIPKAVGPGSWLYSTSQLGKDFNPEYAEKLVPYVLKSIEDWNRRLGLGLETPVTTKHIETFYVSDQGGWPHCEVTFSNKWFFIFRNQGVTQASSPRRFFDSDHLPFRVRDYAGKWRLSEPEAIELARKTVAKLDLPAGFIRTEDQPRVFRPTQVQGFPNFPRLQIDWSHEDQRIQVEVDCDKGTVESVYFDDASFWGKPPPIDVPIRKPPAAPVEP